MKLNEFIEKGGQKLRLGYTTGSCAAGAAKAAAVMLLTGRPLWQVRLMTPKGIHLMLDIEDICFWNGENEVISQLSSGIGHVGDAHDSLSGKRLTAVSCAVRKDGGDDPDATDKLLIYARVSLSHIPGIRIDGGEGVGRITRPGLDQPVGEAAINSTPRRMIKEALLEVLPPAFPGADVTIYVPKGRAVAEKTFNPKLGILGGISILGTSGIVEPMSDEALLATIRAEISVRKAEGLTTLAVVPGNYGKSFFFEQYGFSLDAAVTASNFIYDTVLMAADAGFKQLLLVGHIGKLVKIAGGVRNTHSRYGDRRMEILTDIAEDCIFLKKAEGDGNNCRNRFESPGRERAEQETPYEASDTHRDHFEIPERERAGQETPYEADDRRWKLFESLRRELAACVMTEEAVNILRRYGVDQPVLREMTDRIKTVMEGWSQGRLAADVVVFSKAHGELGRTENALASMAELHI